MLVSYSMPYALCSMLFQFLNPAIQNPKSVDRIPFALQTSLVSAVKPIPGMSLLGGLLLGPLSLGFLLSSCLIRSPHAAQQSSAAGSNGSTSAGITCDSPPRCSNCCTTGGATD